MIIIGTQDEMRKKALDYINENEIVVELGCGEGNFISILNEAKNITKYIGIDIDHQKIELCKKLYTKNNLEFVCANIMAPHIQQYIWESHIITSFQTLEHVGTFRGNEDIEFISNIPSKKHFVFSVPNSPYRKEHKRWFEIDGWVNRYDK